ncbi:hypothetical protein WK76_24915 [Burkholderia ubonensis]|nr:hypothetical protein WK76_24915 [Burkholderia ubonensis]
MVALVIFVLFEFGPSIGDGLAFVWYGWAHILTRDYTTVLPAALLEWSSLHVTVWSICVAAKLIEAESKVWRMFALVAASVCVCGVIPANCAIWAMDADAPIATWLDAAARFTAFGVMFVCTVSAVVAPFIAFVVVEE